MLPAVLAGAARMAAPGALNSAAKWVAGTALASAAVNAAMPDEPEPADNPQEEGAEQQLPQAEQAGGLAVTPIGNGMVRVSFPVKSPKAIHYGNALSEFGAPVDTTNKDGDAYKVYTLTQKEFERLQAQGGSR